MKRRLYFVVLHYCGSSILSMCSLHTITLHVNIEIYMVTLLILMLIHAQRDLVHISLEVTPSLLAIHFVQQNLLIEVQWRKSSTRMHKVDMKKANILVFRSRISFSSILSVEGLTVLVFPIGNWKF